MVPAIAIPLTLLYFFLVMMNPETEIINGTTEATKREIK